MLNRYLLAGEFDLTRNGKIIAGKITVDRPRFSRDRYLKVKWRNIAARVAAGLE